MDWLINDALPVLARIFIVWIFPFSFLDKVINWDNALKQAKSIPTTSPSRSSTRSTVPSSTLGLPFTAPHLTSSASTRVVLPAPAPP